MEQTIFSKVMQIGLARMRCYFAEKEKGMEKKNKKN